MKKIAKILFVLCLTFCFVLSSFTSCAVEAILSSDIHFDPNWWYTVNGDWINITKTTYKLSIPVSGRITGGITYFYWNSNGQWVNAANPKNQMFYVETEYAEFALTKLHDNNVTILQKTQEVFSFLVRGETAEWEASILYVFYADKDWFYAEGYLRAKKAWSGGVQHDIIWTTDFYDDSEIYLLSANGSAILWDAIPRSWPLMFGNGQFPWECYRRKVDGFTIGVIFMDVLPRTGIHVEGTPEQQISWHTGGYAAENETFRSKVVIYPYVQHADNFYNDTANLSKELSATGHIPMFQKLDHYAYGMEGLNWDIENAYIHFGTYENWPPLGYSFGYQRFVHGWPAESIETVLSNNTVTDFVLPGFTDSDSNIVYPAITYPPTSTSDARHPWTIAPDYVKICGIQESSMLSANHTVWLYSDSNMLFADVKFTALTEINVTSFSADFNVRLNDWIKIPWDGSINELNSTSLSLSWYDYDLMRDVSIVYLFRGVINVSLGSDLQRLRINLLMTQQETFEPGQEICGFQLTCLFTEKKITETSQIDVNPHIFENVSSIYSGNSWFYHDVELKPQTSDFGFYTNSTVLYVDSLAEEDLEMTVWGQSGTTGIYYVVSKKGSPSFVMNENHEYLTFTYNDSLNTSIFEANFGDNNVQKITLEWNRKSPKNYLFNVLPDEIWKVNQSSVIEMSLENQDDFTYTDLYLDVTWTLGNSTLNSSFVLPEMSSGEQFNERYWITPPISDGTFNLTLSLRYAGEAIAVFSKEIQVLRGTNNYVANLSVMRMLLIYGGIVVLVTLVMLASSKLNREKRERDES